ncbi:hypothetical protein PsorP6_003632 [Peronosclerospora sorghi]|uniref:Uncharacterized protein n=1 Tax=Peronosclerospora sorghi TaxID=230839 RepID=A0ACC0VRF9_9STRA|nr:hypothetical protein PsorP6_003632 [Peronosclerospora sorghi]
MTFVPSEAIPNTLFLHDGHKTLKTFTDREIDSNQDTGKIRNLSVGDGPDFADTNSLEDSKRPPTVGKRALATVIVVERDGTFVQRNALFSTPANHRHRSLRPCDLAHQQASQQPTWLLSPTLATLLDIALGSLRKSPRQERSTAAESTWMSLSSDNKTTHFDHLAP